MTLQYWKWLATILCIIGVCLSSVGIYPLYLYLFIASSTIWVYCGMVMGESSIVVMNSACVMIEIIGRLWKIYYG